MNRTAKWIAIGLLWAEGMLGLAKALVGLVLAVIMGVLCLPVLGLSRLAGFMGQPVAQPEPKAAQGPSGDSEGMRLAKANALELAMKHNPSADPSWFLERAAELN